MMDFTSGQYLQLIIGLVLVLVAFIGAYLGPERAVVTVLVLLLPFQPITSKFGTLNTGLALLVFFAFLLNGRIRRFPLLVFAGLIMLAYLVSFTQVPRGTYPDHFFYLVAMAANFAIFFIAYKYVSRSGNLRGFFNILLWMNVLFDLYCFAQLLMGVDPGAALGLGDLSLQANRVDSRLAGPFTAVGMTAEYLVIQIMLLLHMYMHESKKTKKVFVASVAMANLAFLVATGNRGGFLILVLGVILYLFWFRRELGLGKLLASAAVGGVMLAVMSVIVVTFTDFNVLYERLMGTEVREGLPDSRSVIWPLAWERIQDAPVIGHGPRVRLIEEELRRIPGHVFMPYPHSAYLFLLYTIGIVGLIAWFAFFFALYIRFRRAKRNLHPDPFIARLPKLSILILILFLIDQMKVAMLRFNLSDYQQIVFVLLGGLLAAAWVATNPPRPESS
jgi:O-antigen ligase